MWLEFFRFDLRYQLRQPLLWVMTLAMVALAFTTGGSDNMRLGGGIGNVHLNAPVVVANVLSIFSIIAMFLVTMFIAGAVLRDSEVGISDMIFATPMRKIDYLLGRFLAGFVTCLCIFVLTTLAMKLGASKPGIDPARLSAATVQPYVWSFVFFVLPNLLFVAALLMLLAATTRSIMLVYVGVLAFIVLWSIAGFLITDPSKEWIAALLDPFGIRALARTTRYFSTFESNTVLPSLSGVLLLNRLIWSGISLALFALTVVLFKPQRAGTGRRLFGKAASVTANVSAPVSAKIKHIAPLLSAQTAWAQCWAVLGFDMKAVLKSVPFLVMLLLAIANFFANVTIGGMRFDSTPYPLTRLMLEELSGGFNIVLVFVLIFYAGELIFKERQAKIADVVDAMPVPNWVPLLAKCAALISVILVFMLVGIIAAIGIQLVKGGAPVEGLLYLKGVLLSSVYFVLMGLCALALQVLTNNKFVGYLMIIGLMILSSAMGDLDFNHRLYNFASLPNLRYSDMNGYGHFLTGWAWFALYWSLFVVALLITAQAFSVRGLSQGLRSRIRLAGQNLKGSSGLALALSLAGFGATGAWIFYNTNVLNHYEAADVILDNQASYEKLYSKYKDLPHPRITDVRADVDIFPAERRVMIKGQYILQNKTATALDTLRIQTDTKAETSWTNLPLHQVVLDDKKFGFSIIKLKQPLAPGASIAMDFDVKVINRGFTNAGRSDTVNLNGSFFTDRNFFPKFGYNNMNELEDRNQRRERGLGEPGFFAKLEDQAARARHFFSIEADFVNFDTTVSTSSDQIAMAPGYLQDSWEKDGRRYYHYKMDQPMVPFFAYLSAKYEVKKADWKGMPIEIYYDKKHAYNIDSMISGTQDSLAYYSEQFGPYPHKQVRVLEFPNYGAYAQSFSNTIPFSESLGFINDLRDKNGVDHVFYVTAHEMAHQWWGEQVMAANVQGNPMIVESLAEYSALMVVEKRFGREKVRHILRFDLDDYLSGRSKELIEELPLNRVSGQIYIQYRKASLIFYRLRDEIGEVALNRALKKFLEAYRFQAAPYATSKELIDFIRAETPAEKQALLTDMFEKIVFYDNRVTEASAKQRSDGQWDVTMKLRLAKSEADGKGKETARNYDEPVEIAIFSRAAGVAEKDEKVLFTEKRLLPGGDSTMTITVKDKPYEVGVDPYHILIDKNSADNRKILSFN